jgi:hypothetical protein
MTSFGILGVEFRSGILPIYLSVYIYLGASVRYTRGRCDLKAKNVVLNISETEAKVREATNDEPWYVADSFFFRSFSLSSTYS